MDSCHTHSHLLGFCQSCLAVPGTHLAPSQTSRGSDQQPWTCLHIQLLCNLATLLGVKLTTSTSYHPQTDSQTECVNQEIEAYLQVFISHQQDNWADWLPLVEFAYNNKVHSATCWTPFELDASQHLCLGVEPMRMSTIEAVDAFAR